MSNNSANIKILKGLQNCLSNCSGTVVGGTALQAGSLRVRFPMGYLDVYKLKCSVRTLALGSVQPLTEMSTSDIFWKVNAAAAQG